jgi:hypothetical protein
MAPEPALEQPGPTARTALKRRGAGVSLKDPKSV